MPEGPILAILKEELARFKHKEVVAASGYAKGIDFSRMEGKKMTDIKTWGKHLLLCFPEFTIRVHMMLFGSYRINSRGKKNAVLGMEFSNGEVNFYISSIKLIEEPLDKVYDWSADLLSDDWNPKKALEKVKASPKKMICDVMLDQQIFSGSGNIIKNETLFRSKIHPQNLVADIPDKKIKELIKQAVVYSFDFLRWKKEGTLSKHFEAYEQDICPRNHIPFHKADLGKTKRHTYYCDKCQVVYSEVESPEDGKSERKEDGKSERPDVKIPAKRKSKKSGHY